MTRDDIKTILQSEHSYALDMKFAKAFAELTGRPETSVLHQIRSLTSRREAEMTGRNKYEMATRSALESIWAWYTDADHFREMSTSVALDMLESHDPSCIWAVMLGQQSAKLNVA